MKTTDGVKVRRLPDGTVLVGSFSDRALLDFLRQRPPAADQVQEKGDQPAGDTGTGTEGEPR